jgi:MFS family permease
VIQAVRVGADVGVVLSGTLNCLGLERLIRFIGSLQLTGELVLTSGQRSGGLGFEAGRVVGTWYAAERGISALEGIVLALADAEFSLLSSAPRERNIELDEQQLVDHLRQLTARRELVMRGLAVLTEAGLVTVIGPTSSASAPLAAQPRQVGIFTTLRETSAATRFLLFGVFVNQLGAFMQAFLVLFLVRAGLGDGPAGLALGAYGLGAVVGTLFGGELADRLGRRPTIIGSMACAAVLTVAVSFLATPQTYVALLAVVAGAGAMAQSCRTAAGALLSDLTPPGRRVMLFSMYRIALNSGGVLGPLLAAWLISMSWNLLFWADGITSLGYALVALLWFPRQQRVVEPSPAVEDGPTQTAGYSAVLRDGRFLLYLFAMLANVVIYTQYFAVLPLKIDTGAYPSIAYNWVLALSAGLVITCELLITRKVQSWPATRAASVGIGLLGLGLALFGVSGGLPLLLSATVIGVIGQMISGPTMLAHPGRVAPPAATGRYIGAGNAMFGLGGALGAPAGVLVWNNLGDGIWVICAIVAALATGAAAIALRPVQSKRIHSAQESHA